MLHSIDGNLTEALRVLLSFPTGFPWTHSWFGKLQRNLEISYDRLASRVEISLGGGDGAAKRLKMFLQPGAIENTHRSDQERHLAKKCKDKQFQYIRKVVGKQNMSSNKR